MKKKGGKAAKKTLGDRVAKAAAKKAPKATKSSAKVPAAKPTPKKAAASAQPAKATKSGTNKMSGLDAAAKVLQDAGKPMNVGDMVTAMAKAELWTSTAPTPGSTIYAAIVTEIKNKGKESRFVKTDRGLFEFVAPTPAGNR